MGTSDIPPKNKWGRYYIDQHGFYIVSTSLVCWHRSIWKICIPNKLIIIHWFFWKAWDRFFNTTATEWYNFHLSWLTSGIPLYILNYRALKENLKPELVKLASHLGEPTLSEEHLQCVLDNAEGSAKRPHERPSWLFPPDKRQVWDEMVLHVCTLILEKTGIQILLW